LLEKTISNRAHSDTGLGKLKKANKQMQEGEEKIDKTERSKIIEWISKQDIVALSMKDIEAHVVKHHPLYLQDKS